MSVNSPVTKTKTLDIILPAIRRRTKHTWKQILSLCQCWPPSEVPTLRGNAAGYVTKPTREYNLAFGVRSLMVPVGLFRRYFPGSSQHARKGLPKSVPSPRCFPYSETGCRGGKDLDRGSPRKQGLLHTCWTESGNQGLMSAENPMQESIWNQRRYTFRAT